MGISLYELTEEQARIERALQESDGEELQAKLEDITEARDEKLKGCGAVYLNLTAEAKMCEDEAKKLKERADTIYRKAERLREYAEQNMIAGNIPEIKAGLFNMKFRKTPPKVVGVDIDKLSEEYKRTIPAKIEPDKKAIIDDYKQGLRNWGL